MVRAAAEGTRGNLLEMWNGTLGVPLVSVTKTLLLRSRVTGNGQARF